MARLRHTCLPAYRLLTPVLSRLVHSVRADARRDFALYGHFFCLGNRRQTLLLGQACLSSLPQREGDHQSTQAAANGSSWVR